MLDDAREKDVGGDTGTSTLFLAERSSTARAMKEEEAYAPASAWRSTLRPFDMFRKYNSTVTYPPPPPTRRFQKLIAYDFVLLREVAGFVEIGYDLREITIGNAIPEAAIYAHVEHIARDVFPPRGNINIMDVSADGDAKVLPKCGKKDTFPKSTCGPSNREESMVVA